MTAYTTDTLVKELLLGLGDATAYASVNFTTIIARAQNKIDAKLAGRYAVPFTTVPPLIGNLATEIGAFLVFKLLLATNKIAGSGESQVWAEQYKEAIRALDELAEGKMLLVDRSEERRVGKECRL